MTHLVIPPLLYLSEARRYIMSVSTLNNSIISYCEFFDKLCKNPSSSDIQNSLIVVKKYYNSFIKNKEIIFEIKKYLEQLNTENAYDILLSFDNEEQVWAYIHLMVETIVDKPLHLWSQIRSFSDMNAFQNGMKKIWSKGHKTVYTVML